VFNTLLQVLDDGRLTYGQGHTVDFRNTIVIMTSNVGTEHVRQARIGLVRSHDKAAEEQAHERVNEALREAFRPEFLNRIDEIVVFNPLTEIELTQIIDLLIKEVVDRVRDQGMTLELTKAAKTLLVREGYHPSYGARPLRRTVQRMVETPLSRALLKSDFKPGDTIIVDVEGQALTFSTRETLALSKKKPAEPMGA